MQPAAKEKPLSGAEVTVTEMYLHCQVGGRSAHALGRRHNVTSGWEAAPATRFKLVPCAQLIRQRISDCDDAR
jgi:hypothetical protein